jgi:hypothetical protein
MPEFRLTIITLSLAIIVGFGLISCLSGCSLLRDPCGAVMPTVVTSQAQLADVQRALAEVERSGVRNLLKSPDARKGFDDAMARAWAAYEVAVKSIALASESCSQPSIAGLLAEIVEAWTIIRSFVNLFGGGQSAGAVSDPIVWTEAQR